MVHKKKVTHTGAQLIGRYALNALNALLQSLWYPAAGKPLLDVFVSQKLQCLLSCTQQVAGIQCQLETLKLLKQIVFRRFRKLALCDGYLEPVIMGTQRRHQSRLKRHLNRSMKNPIEQ